MWKLILIILFISSPWLLHSSNLVKNSIFENYTVSDGLSDERIHCILQDSKGWIWLGTDFGVTKFDGYEFTSIETNNESSKSLKKTLIRTIFEDKNGSIWIGTEMEGLFKYDRSKNLLKQFNKLPCNYIHSISPDSDGNLWLGTMGGGIQKFNISTELIDTIINTSNCELLPNNRIKSICKTSNNQYWVGTEEGIVVFDNRFNPITKYFTDKTFKPRENRIECIYQDAEDDIWVGTYLGGLWKLDLRSNQFKHIKLDKNNQRSKTVRSIIQDNKGLIWLGTRGGLFSYDKYKGDIKHFTKSINDNFSLIHNSVLCVFSDVKGDLWVGTRNGFSFLNFDKQAFGYISSNKTNQLGLNNNEIYSIWEDNNDQIWMGTESGGVNIYNIEQDAITHLTVEDGLSNNCVKAICPDNRGNILIGTYLGGLNIYNQITKELEIYKHDPKDPNSISGNDVWAILKDSRNRIWVGTSSGLDLFDENSKIFKHFGQRYNLQEVSMIFEDNKQNFWIYSADLEITTLIKSNGEFEEFDLKGRAICVDDSDNIWLATLGDGLVKMDNEGNILEQFTTENGLSSNILQGIINIDNKELWISSNYGLTKFDMETKEFKNFDSSDGLLNTKFNYGAFCMLRSRKLIFGGQKGLDIVDHNLITKNGYIPPVFITAFRLFNKGINASDTTSSRILRNIISETDSIELKYNQNMISFDFAALNFVNSNRNKYKYKLEGFDEEWNDIGNSRTATYTNLSHGEYTFKVIGSNNDNLFNNEGAKLAIIIHPPIWKTTWFKLVMVLLLILLFFGIFFMIRNREKLKHELIYQRQSSRDIQELDRLKHQFFMNISHEIRTPLSLIIGPLEKVLSMDGANDSVTNNLNLIKRNYLNLKKLVDQLLDYRKIETGNLKLELKKGNMSVFVDEITSYFKHAAEDKEINLEYNTAQKSYLINFDSDKVEKIINNLLSNAIKYTHPGGKVNVNLSKVFVDDIKYASNLIPPLESDEYTTECYMKIKITDTGIGVSDEDIPLIFNRFKRINNVHDREMQGTGIGLAFTKELVIIHNGNIRVESKKGKGSSFTVYLPYDESSVSETTSGIEENHNKLQNHSKNDIFSINKQQSIMLVVDDNTDIRNFIKNHFQPEYKIVEAKNGKEGWSQVLNIVPDIVIADVLMPIMGGNELCKRMKRDERTSHIPIIMLSALGSNENQLAGIDAGADDYMTKPFDIGLLKAKVDNTLSIRKSLREQYSKEMILKPKDIVLTSPDEKFLRKMISLIEKNINNENIDVEFLSQNLNVSRTQLYRKVRALTDMSPKEFVRDLRLQRASQLLLQNKLNFSEVAYNVGFNDVKYFRKCFKEKFGMNASEFKKRNL